MALSTGAGSGRSRRIHCNASRRRRLGRTIICGKRLAGRTQDLAPGWQATARLDGVEVDGFNLKNPEGVEYLNRKRILLEDAQRGDPDNPWMGEDEGGTGGSSITTQVAAESTRGNAVAKERRKAIEAKRAKGDKSGNG